MKRLHFYSDLQNPSLTGGLLRLPLREMALLHSRPHGQKERWFPTEEGDWVELSDGTFGRVDTNPFQVGTQSIPAPDVQVVSTFFRQ